MTLRERKGRRIILILLALVLFILLVGPFLIPVPPLKDTVPPEQLADPVCAIPSSNRPWVRR